MRGRQPFEEHVLQEVVERTRLDPGLEGRLEQVGRLDHRIELVLLERVGAEAMDPEACSGSEDEREPPDLRAVPFSGTMRIDGDERMRHRSASSRLRQVLERRLQVVPGELMGMQVAIEEISGVAAQSFPLV